MSVTKDEIERLFEGYPNYSAKVAKAVADVIYSAAQAQDDYYEFEILLSQSGITAPSFETVSTNLPAMPVAQYVAVGSYKLVLAGGFPAGRTSVIMNNISDPSSGYLFGAYANSPNEIILVSTDAVGTPIDDAMNRVSLRVKIRK